MGKKLTLKDFIERARKIHGDRYDYSKVNYVNNYTDVIIICPIHGEFKQKPKYHMMGHKCPFCANNKLSNNEEFIKKARKIHGDKYNYFKVNYINNKTKVIIICPEHGEFLQRPSDHLKGCGCRKCSRSEKISIFKFIEKVNNVYNNKYDYSEILDVSIYTKIKIKCPIHGEFYQTINNHLQGKGCPKCKNITKNNNIENNTKDNINNNINDNTTNNNNIIIINKNKEKFHIDYNKFKRRAEQHKKEIREFLDEHNIKYEIDGDRFKFYDKDNNCFYQIGYVNSIEYPIAYPQYGIEGVDKKYFYRLSREAEEQGSFICWIKDFEWAHPRKREVLKSYILHATGKTPNRWYARDCIVKEVPPSEGLKFEDTHCFYGRRGASLRLGLYSKKEKNGYKTGTLLMLYSFGANFFAKKKSIIEVIRVGTLLNSIVVGGASKLLKYFLNNYENIKIGNDIIKIKSLKFYSDYDHNKGKSLLTQNIGWEFLGYSEGGFQNLWLNDGDFGTIKHRSPMHHKEVMELTKQGKVIAIPNAGVKTFILNINYNKEDNNKRIYQ